MRIRVVIALAALAAVAPGEEGDPQEPSVYAAMGFPVTFNDEIITANDVARYVELPLEEIEPVTLRRSRDVLVFRKISERIAADLGLGVTEEEVNETIRREVEMRGGDAKFYEWLAQQGLTLERFKLERWQAILEQKLAYLFRNGISHDRMQLLPGRIRPTPRELETAFRHDAERRGGAVRARRLRIEIDVDEDFRKSMVRQQLSGKSREWVAEQIEENVRQKVEATLAELEKRPFPDVARELGSDVDAMEKEWLTVRGATEVERFLASAGAGERSEPIPLPGGKYAVVLLIERDDPSAKSPNDPEVAEEYDRKIRALRATKWEAILRMRALDGSTVSPDRVKEEIRGQILASLREAEDQLAALGLK